MNDTNLEKNIVSVAILNGNSNRIYTVYRRNFGTPQVHKPYEDYIESLLHKKAWAHALLEVLHFQVKILQALNPFNAGNSNGADHIVPVENIHINRLKRNINTPLCTKKKFWELSEIEQMDYPCLKCIEIIEKIIDPKNKEIKRIKGITTNKLA